MTRSLLAAMLDLRCPRCREGKMFKTSALNVKRFDEMYEQCPKCGLYYEIEVGFYWGAMYISYGFSVALVVLVGIILYQAGDPSIWVYVAAVTLSVIVLTPLFFRYARMLMLYMFGSVTYDPDAIRKYAQK
jgi:uncharacterized protein (DUF983 family)